MVMLLFEYTQPRWPGTKKMSENQIDEFWIFLIHKILLENAITDLLNIKMAAH